MLSATHFDLTGVSVFMVYGDTPPHHVVLQAVGIPELGSASIIFEAV